MLQHPQPSTQAVMRWGASIFICMCKYGLFSHTCCLSFSSVVWQGHFPYPATHTITHTCMEDLFLGTFICRHAMGERDYGKMTGLKKITVWKLLWKIQLLLPGWNTISIPTFHTQHSTTQGGLKGGWSEDTTAKLC